MRSEWESFLRVNICGLQQNMSKLGSVCSVEEPQFCVTTTYLNRDLHIHLTHHKIIQMIKSIVSVSSQIYYRDILRCRNRLGNSIKMFLLTYKSLHGQASVDLSWWCNIVQITRITPSVQSYSWSLEPQKLEMEPEPLIIERLSCRTYFQNQSDM